MNLLKSLTVFMCASMMFGISAAEAAKIRVVKIQKAKPPVVHQVKKAQPQKTEASKDHQNISKTAGKDTGSSDGFVSDALSAAVGFMIGSTIMNTVEASTTENKDKQKSNETKAMPVTIHQHSPVVEDNLTPVMSISRP